MNFSQPEAFSFDWSLPAAFLWGLTVIASLTGWGYLVDRLLAPDQKEASIGWALAAAWGMATFLALSGPALMLSIFSTVFVALFLLAGWGFLTWHLLSARRQKMIWIRPTAFGFKTLFVAFSLFIFLTYAGAVANHLYNDGDDFAAYFSFSKMALDMGTLSDPFNFRLVGSVGGQSILSTLVVAFLPWKYTHLLDMGIAELIVLGLTQELTRGYSTPSWIARAVLLAFALTFALPRDNTASELTGTVLFLALFHCLGWIVSGRIRGWQSAFLLGILAMAASTLRCHNIFVILILAIGFIAWSLSEEAENPWEILRTALLTFFFTAILLAPWWVVTYRSSGAFLYPLFTGTQRPDAEQFNSHFSHLDMLRFTVGFFFSSGFLLFFLPTCVLQADRERRVVLVLAIALLSISFLFVFKLAGTGPTYFDLTRYLDPIGFAFALYTGSIVAQQMIGNASKRDTRLLLWRRVFVMVSVVTVLFLQGLNFLVQSVINVGQIIWAVNSRHEMATDYFGRASTDEERRDYIKAFAQIPLGSKTLVTLDYPFLLNYRSHSIYSTDVTGIMSPEPGLPFFQGGMPVKQYLLSQSIRYIAHVPFDHSLYLHGRKNAQDRLRLSLPMYKFYAKRELNFQDNIDQLALSNRVLYDSPTIRVIDLGSPENSTKSDGRE